MLYLILVNDKRNWKKLINGEDEQVLKFSSWYMQIILPLGLGTYPQPNTLTCFVEMHLMSSTIDEVPS
jgi:hypothetical protein